MAIVEWPSKEIVYIEPQQEGQRKKCNITRKIVETDSNDEGQDIQTADAKRSSGDVKKPTAQPVQPVKRAYKRKNPIAV